MAFCLTRYNPMIMPVAGRVLELINPQSQSVNLSNEAYPGLILICADNPTKWVYTSIAYGSCIAWHCRQKDGFLLLFTFAGGYEGA